MLSVSPQPFRANVAALIRCEGMFLACERADLAGSWQCVQGGVNEADSSEEDAILREIHEELGVGQDHLTFLARSRCWRRYRFPGGRTTRGPAVGQEQLWFEWELDSLASVRLESACGEFRSVKLVSALDLARVYVAWKRPVVIDFLQERGLLLPRDVFALSREEPKC